MPSLINVNKNNLRLVVGCRVSGQIGPLVPNPNERPGFWSCCVYAEGTGTLVSSVGYAKWKVLCDVDGKICTMSTCQLKIVDELVGVPMDKPIKEMVS